MAGLVFDLVARASARVGQCLSIGKTRSARILQWDKQPEGMT